MRYAVQGTGGLEHLTRFEVKVFVTVPVATSLPVNCPWKEVFAWPLSPFG